MPQSAYPVPAYNYSVNINGEACAFSEVSGLQLEYETVVYRDGLSFKKGIELSHGQRVVSRVTLKRGVAQGRSNLLNWMNARERKNIYINLNNEAGKPILQWDLRDAIAVKIDMRDFSAASNNVSIETLELIVYDIRIHYYES